MSAHEHETALDRWERPLGWAALGVLWLCPWLLPQASGFGFVACSLVFLVAAVIALSVLPDEIRRRARPRRHSGPRRKEAYDRSRGCFMPDFGSESIKPAGIALVAALALAVLVASWKRLLNHLDHRRWIATDAGPRAGGGEGGTDVRRT